MCPHISFLLQIEISYNFILSFDMISYGTVNIGIDSDGNKHFYEINKIKEIDDISGKNLNRSSTSSINNSITPDNQTVNTSVDFLTFYHFPIIIMVA